MVVITENRLDGWVRDNAQNAQGIIVDLVWRLVAAASPKPKARRFPLRDSIDQPGPDGILDTNFGYPPFVPEGKSYWEIGTGTKPGGKATTDYKKIAKEIHEDDRRQSSVIFVTPFSGRRGWTQPSQKKWLKKRRELNEWKDISIIDGTGLIDWLRQFPSVELWLAQKMGFPTQYIETLEQRWDTIKMFGNPPPLIPHVFLANRDAACAKLEEVFSGTMCQLKIDTHYPKQIIDFISAYIASRNEDTRFDIEGRCLIISSQEAWKTFVELRESHVFVADFDLDDSHSGTLLLQQAQNKGHAVIYGGVPGGIPHPNRINLPNPKKYELRGALEKAGYKTERARVLADKCEGNLTSLLRCLHNLSLAPEWAQESDAADLAIAVLLGSWDEGNENDKIVVENIVGKAYGEWIATIRKIALRPGTPLNHHDGIWKFVSRYEGWYALSKQLFDEHLDRFKDAAVRVLRERDPQFDIPPEERMMARVRGKSFGHSEYIRKGLADALALLGNHSKALTQCSQDKSRYISIIAVREILADDDWVLWASLDRLLPLLAEASPTEFLDAVERSLNMNPCPFDMLFSQETTGVFGRNYTTGLLWSLELLAWDKDYLIRVVSILGELASKDPGGNYANRPIESLSTILLPWFPQTCASLQTRKKAVQLLLKKIPDIGWKLILALLPQSHQSTFGSYKPVWRESIPEDWINGVSHQEYQEQVSGYAELAIEEAKSDFSKLIDLIDRIDDLPPPAREQLLVFLESDSIVQMPEKERFPIWNELNKLVIKHRKFEDADWAMPPEIVDNIAEITKKLIPNSPIYRHQRLFRQDTSDLFDEKDNYEEQIQEIERQRRMAIEEIFKNGGVLAVLDFTRLVESPWGIGFSLGIVADKTMDSEILPVFLESEEKTLGFLAGGYIKGRFKTCGWDWVDNLNMANWTDSEKGTFFTFLPFDADTWDRVSRLLIGEESPYWLKTTTNPFEAEKNFEYAIDRLIEHGRPFTSIYCLDKLQYKNQPLNTDQAIRALTAAMVSNENPHEMDIYAIINVIKVLQENPEVNQENLSMIEWYNLPLLTEHHDASPKTLERRLASDPKFFCEIIRTIYCSKNHESPVEEPTESQKNAASNAYQLLHEWKTPPGLQDDGTFIGEKLFRWFDEVKKICTETGHLEIALDHVGHVLVYAPKDPDELWISHPAASILDEKDAKDMRDGFTTELYNSRGVFTWTAGNEERQLASKYRSDADAVESHGYFRLAQSLRKLADSYERTAEREENRDPFED